MALVVPAIAISNTKVKLRWRETYVTEGENQRALAHPRGIYRGFLMAQTAPASKLLRLIPCNNVSWAGLPDIDEDQFAMYRNRTLGFEVSIRESGIVTLDMTAAFTGGGGTIPAAATWWVWMRAAYAASATTTADYVVTDQDPHNPASVVHDANAVVIGQITFVGGEMTILMDPTASPAGTYTERTSPMPTSVENAAALAGGEETWGFLDAYNAWRIPSYNQKEALNHSPNAPTSANPVATQADITPTTNKIVAEPRIITVAGAGASFVDFDPAANDPFYIGKGGAGTPKDWFFVSVSQSNVPYHVNQRLIRVGAVQDFVTHAPLTGIGSADANGFYDGIRLTFVYEDGTAATLPMGVDVDIWCQQKTLMHDLDETPAEALPVAMRPQRSHADDAMVRQYDNPPWMPQATSFTVGDAIRKLQVQNRGHAALAMTDDDLCAAGYWTSPDGHMFSAINTIAMNINDSYIAMTTARYLDSRYLLILVNLSIGGSVVYKMDLETYVKTTYIVGATLPAGTWHATDICCNGDQFFVRFYCNAGASDHQHRVIPYFVASGGVVLTWAAGGTLIGIGTGPVDFNPTSPKSWKNASIICATSSYLAVNKPWVQLNVDHNVGIVILDQADGATVSSGCGDFGAGTIANTYAAGGLASDGTNVYFAVQETVAGDTYAGQCTIANADVSSVADWRPQALVPGLPRGILYDGYYVWVSTELGLFVGPSDEASLMFFNVIEMIPGKNSAMGPMVYDGKKIYVGMYSSDYTASSQALWLMQINPDKLAWGTGPAGAVGDIFTIAQNWWQWDPGQPTTVVEWGPICFDGQDVWCFSEGDSGAAKNGTLRRLPMVKFQ